MRSLKNPVVALPAGLVLLVIVTTAAEACFRCRVAYQPAAPQVVTQIVQVPTKPNNEDSHVIRALVIIDNNDEDPTYDKDVKLDGIGMLQMLFNLRDWCPNPKVLMGKETTREKILYEIEYGMEVGKNDTLFVYYIGHGEQNADYADPQYSMGHILALQKGSTRDPNGPKKLWRAEVIRAMKSREARLAVLITDSCFAPSSPSDDTMEISSSRFKARKKKEELKFDVDIVRHLFLDQQGLVNINSCMPSEVALGKVFTPILVENLTDWKGDLDPSWQTFFNTVRDQTEKMAATQLKNHPVEYLALDGMTKKPSTQTPFSFGKFEGVEMTPFGAEVESRAVAPSAPPAPAPGFDLTAPPAPVPFPVRATN